MFLVRYKLLIGPGQHYSPTAVAALELVKEIRDSAGHVVSITRTHEGRVVSVDELKKLAELEAISENKPSTAMGARIARLFGRRSA